MAVSTLGSQLSTAPVAVLRLARLLRVTGTPPTVIVLKEPPANKRDPATTKLFTSLLAEARQVASTAPVAASSLASRVRLRPPTFVNVPPTNRLDPSATMVSTALRGPAWVGPVSVSATKPGSSAPVVASRAARLARGTRPGAGGEPGGGRRPRGAPPGAGGAPPG